MTEAQANDAIAPIRAFPPVDKPLQLETAVAAAVPSVANVASKSTGARNAYLRRFFWLEQSIVEISNSDFGLNRCNWPEFELVRQARNGARLLRKNEPARIVLKWTEVVLLLRGLIKRHGLDCDGPYLTETAWSAAEKVVAVRDLLSNLTVDQRTTLKACLGQDAELSLVDLDSNQRREVAVCLDCAEQHLVAPLDRDDKRVRRIIAQRWMRVGTATALALFCLGFGGVKLFQLSPGENIALHRPTQVSSIAAEGTQGAELVDGITDNLGFHTNDEPNPSVVIDLGTSRRFDRIVVYNRADCCQERAIPLSIDVSDDGTTFRTVAKRNMVFEKWTAKGLHARGRYVRLQLHAAHYFHLAEVEIY
jgi:hypothetical protein